MGRTVLCENRILEDLENACGENVIVPGLIIGQFAGQKDFVFHLPKTRFIPNDEDGSAGDQGKLGLFTKLSDVDESAIAEHARTVTRMLPGGTWILGYYIISPSNVFEDKNSVTKLKTMAQAVYNCTKGNSYMCGRDPSNQMLIFNYCSSSKRYSCKSLDVGSLNSSLRPADWKFKDNITNWLVVDSNLNLRWMPPVILSKNNLSTKKKCQEVLTKFQEHLDGLLFCINGNFCSLDKTVLSLKRIEVDEVNKKEKTEKKKKKKDYELLFYEFKVPSEDHKFGITEKISKDLVFKLKGTLGSRVYLYDKSTVEDAVKAVKEDLLRSFASRLEMHWQTYEEPENLKNKYLVRYPPRRVLFTPKRSKIAFSEYIFEEETERDALATLCENLGYEDGNVSALEEVWIINEDQCEESCLILNSKYVNNSPSNAGNIIYKKAGRSDKTVIDEQIEEPAQKKVKTVTTQSNNIIIYGIVAAFVCLIISLSVNLFLT